MKYVIQVAQAVAEQRRIEPKASLTTTNCRRELSQPMLEYERIQNSTGWQHLQHEDSVMSGD